eukprot:TRINITY_DN36849_c0_g1_i1.p1 TRINITY_DN36849_c0_g1~~TRINITY_DN36849_c0_g1_i1.p1  ORF type:complete len:201 (-),score=28.67 TRINITY_DN36849_c0_g1_i1:65-667(-)
MCIRDSSFLKRRFLLKQSEHATISIPISARLSTQIQLAPITAIQIFKPSASEPEPPREWTVLWNTPSGNCASLDGDWENRGKIYLMYSRERTFGRPISSFTIAIYPDESHPSINHTDPDLVCETGLRIWCSRLCSSGASSGMITDVILTSCAGYQLGQGEQNKCFDPIPARYQLMRFSIKGHEADVSTDHKPLFLCLRYS